ncbi:unnamed protein product, partial [marine sediment metagenome]
IGIEGVIRDITELKKAQIEKARLEKEKRANETAQLRLERLASLGQLSSTIAHEINQPLQSIKALTSSFLYMDKVNKKLSYNEIHEDVSKIALRVERIENITKDMRNLLNYPDKVELEKIDINQEIIKAVSFFEQKLRSHGIKLTLDLQENSHEILFSKIQFQQVIINLMNNAISALDQTDKRNKGISIKITEEKDKTLLRFSDNGIGIKNHDMDKIFDFYYSSRKSEENIGM